MTTYIILLAICGGLAWFLWKRRPGKQQKALPEKKDGDALRLENVREKGVLRLTGIGPDFEEFDLQVISRHVYKSGQSRWYELECDRGGSKVWIDFEEDDDLEITVALNRVKLREIGVSKKELERMDDREEGSFKHEGRTYHYEDSDDAVFLKNGDDSRSETLYYWDFESDDETSFVNIERWSDGSFDVTISEPVKASQVTVYSLG